MVVGCTNPAALAGGPGALRSYFATTATMATLAGGRPITTPWAAFDGLLTAECQVRAGHTVLEVSWAADPANPLVERFGGPGLPASWGMHQADVNLAMGNLLELARTQTAAYRH